MASRTLSSAALARKRQTFIKKLRRVGPPLAASLVTVRHRTCDHVAHLLTFKDEGKTKSIYVPLDMVKEVEEWVKNHKKMKELVRQISSLSIGMIRRRVPEAKESARRRRTR